MTITGTIIGYDPGGKDSHGFASFTYNDGKLIAHQICTLTYCQYRLQETEVFHRIK